MKLEDQVCSLKLAKRLKELGVKDNSLFWWVTPTNTCTFEAYIHDSQFIVPYDVTKYNYYSAFTVAELGELLPDIIQITDDFDHIHTGTLKIDKLHRDIWWVYYYEKHEKFYEVADIDEANARAKMLIYLIEDNLIVLPS